MAGRFRRQVLQITNYTVSPPALLCVTTRRTVYTYTVSISALGDYPSEHWSRTCSCYFGGDCCYCGRHLTWGGMGWWNHDNDYGERLHLYWRKYWLLRLYNAMVVSFRLRNRDHHEKP